MDGERERHEDGLRPMQNRDDEHPAGERHPGLHGFQGVVQAVPPFLVGFTGFGFARFPGATR